MDSSIIRSRPGFLIPGALLLAALAVALTPGSSRSAEIGTGHSAGVELVSGAPMASGQDLASGAEITSGTDLAAGAERGSGKDLASGADPASGADIVSGVGSISGKDLASVASHPGEPATADAAAPSAGNAPPACKPELSLAGREIAIDPAATPHMGTLQFPEAQPLNDKEVLLTFDDGPHPERTAAILDSLDRFCVKAVFFPVGEMALEHPGVLREVARRGHVIGAHSYSHPRSLARLNHERAKAEIEMGFAAVAHALGGPVSPLFRFPGLNQAPYLLDYLAEKKVSVWSVDVISGDSEFVGSQHLPSVLFRRLDAQGRGMILFHDLKKTTTDRLVDILQRLKDEGYTAVRPSIPATLKPDDALLATLVRGKPHWPAPARIARQAGERSGSARVAIRSSARLQRVRRVQFEFQEQ